ncbi:ribosome biogenesis GTPase / thiamine phosphate phosphatase [Thermoflexales bacterium]|nr:ribosome biogenesis GTPase / thiamine phosphate phosphatase [Thermoflexales bacterium]
MKSYMKFIDAQSSDCGVVIRKTNNSYLVETSGGTLSCTLAGRFKQGSRADPVVIGDIVRWLAIGPEAGQIVEVLPQRNQLARRSAVPMPTAHAHEQPIAANVDQVVAVFAAAQPRLAWNLLDRYLVSAEAARIPALICLTKLDLVEGRPEAAEIRAVMAEYQASGYPVILTSTVTGAGLSELDAALCDRLSVFVGKSGVGKTSLLNAIEPGLGLRVQAISRSTGKGRHTTTHVELFTLASGGSIIDTPGIREFGLWNVAEDDLAWFFPEMRPFVGTCKFGLDCQHDQEPGCAIRKAVGAGAISPYRYQSYLKLKREP